MKFLANLLDKARPKFEDGGAFRPMKPLFDAIDAFMFNPLSQAKLAPHARDPLDVKRYMSMVIIALLPATFAAFYFYGWRMLPVIMVSYMAGGAVEVLFAVIRKEEINEGFLVTGLLFPLILPPGLPLWMVAVGVIFGVLVGKEIFGGTGRNLFNPALVGRCFLLLSYGGPMGGAWIEPGGGLFGRLFEYKSVAVDAVSQATPLAQAAAETPVITPLGDLFFGNVLGCAGETSALALILGGVLLLLFRVASWRTIGSTLIAFGLMTALLVGGDINTVLFHYLAGGLLLGTFFMATDPVSGPSTNGGKFVYGALIGVATALIRLKTPLVEGMMFAILTGNMFAPIIDEVFIALHVRRLQNEK
ncbi:MAG: RnfABCDGE type electron transport complex subunit D [Phycisphaerales bacterium]|jgi:Na(+)-translocating NADH:ubiquinone oxidoreductase B subunit|nr:RnfABCDGE type electron transport complex subunit D [Phycisphaerales bacterium]